MAFLVALFVLVLALAYLWYNHNANPGGKAGPEVVVVIPKGAGVSHVASVLVHDKVISSGLAFQVFARLHGSGPFQAGYYRIARHESFSTIVADLGRGPVRISVTIPEGFTLVQIGERVGRLVPGHSAQHFAAVARSGQVRSPYEPAGSNNLEGLLFPATYTITPQESDAAIISTMVDKFDQVAQGAGLAQAARSLGLTPYQVITVASMIEREAKLPADRGKVARVIYNRLASGRLLQIDATLLYVLGATHTLTQADLNSPGPYNTYVNKGLPPTPISNPGLASLQAAAAPTPGPWIYYVVVSADGAEAFSTTLAQQQANIDLARSRGLG
ncbi:MAG: endolytic transglycosylase MltG [Acidimicrobiales bacterium]